MSDGARVDRPARIRLLEGLTFSWIYKALAIVVALYATGVAVRHFGLTEYGIWLLVSQLVSICQLLDLGISSSISRVLPKHLAQRSLDTAGAFVSTSLWMLVALGAMILLLAVPLAHFFSGWFPFEPLQRETADTVAATALVITAFGMPARIGFGLLASLHRFDIYFALDTILLLARGAAVFVLFEFFHPTLWDFAVVTLVPQLVSNVIQSTWAFRRTELASLRLRGFSREALRMLLSLSAAAMVTTAATALLCQASPVLLGLQVTTAQVAIFTLPLFVIVHAFSFIQIAAFMSPIASRLAAVGDYARLRRTLEAMGAYTFAVALLVCGLMFIAGNVGFTLWLGAGKVAAADIAEMHKLLVILAAGAALGVPGMISRGALVALGYHWQVAWADLLAAAVGLGVGTGLMLVSEDRLGAMASGVSFGLGLRGLLLAPRLTATCLGARLRSLLVRWFAAPLLTATVAVLLGYGAILAMADGARVGSLLGAGVFALAWLIGTWWLVLNPEDRKRLQDRLHVRAS